MEDALRHLREGTPIAFATETVYGLGAPVFNEAALRKIFTIKGRPSDNPLIVHVADWEMVERVAQEVPEVARLLGGRYWPGPLTLVLKRRPEVPALVSAGLETVAVRMPRHPVARELIRRLGEPIAAPSANLSGRPSPTTAAHVWEDLEGRVPLVLDGGPCEVGIESTVVGLVGVPTLLRPGSIGREELEAVLGCRLAEPQGPAQAPGMKYRHYAPRAEVVVVRTREALAAHAGAYLIEAPDERTLYGQFREADRRGAGKVVVFAHEGLSEALLNRIGKAASRRAVECAGDPVACS